ncbi:MAG: ABC transporter substrate-binding protein [Acidobacteriota bacterium]
MNKIIYLFLILILFFYVCAENNQENLYTIGIFQVNNAPHLNDAVEGFIQALEDNGLVQEDNIKLIMKNAQGDISEAQKIAEGFVELKVDLIAAVSTASLQAALSATHDIPIVFISVANPYRAGAGTSPTDHLSHVTGVSSRGPIREGLYFLKEVMPDISKIGTLWTPSELNSEYYLEIIREVASELDYEVESVPIANSSEVLLSSQLLVSKGVDAIYQISDNTINESFEAVARIALDNGIPLFGGFPLSARMGACAALGWNFIDMGYRSGKMAVDIKNGKNPGEIPFQYMEEAELYINLEAADRQRVEFSEEVINRADKIFTSIEIDSSER